MYIAVAIALRVGSDQQESQLDTCVQASRWQKLQVIQRQPTPLERASCYSARPPRWL